MSQTFIWDEDLLLESLILLSPVQHFKIFDIELIVTVGLPQTGSEESGMVSSLTQCIICLMSFLYSISAADRKGLARETPCQSVGFLCLLRELFI